MILKKLVNQKQITDVTINNSDEKLQQLDLEYYLVEKDIGLNKKVYGIEIIQKKVLINEIFMENEIFNDISPAKEDVERTVKLLADNLVTPITLFDVLVDRLGY